MGIGVILAFKERRMERLSYDVLRRLGYGGYILEKAPEKVLQFGEGNFLRAFADYWFDMANERAQWNGKVLVVQPIPAGLSEEINRQEGLYTLYLRGLESGKKVEKKRVISSVSRCVNPYESSGYEAMMEAAASDSLELIVSNTTEAGIAYDPACGKDDRPPSSFPAKLVQVLYRRWQAGKGPVVILSCELIDDNGKELEKCARKHVEQWGLEPGFAAWMDECVFCTTLVDRIVTGRIRDPSEAARLEAENGYSDELIDAGEVFGVWDIEGPAWLEDKLPFKRAGLNCPVVPDARPYKTRKVRILNGAHTGFALAAYLAGLDIVRECMQDDIVRGFMNKMLHEEVIPSLPLDKKDLEDFASAVVDRFNNPFVDHELLSISLNSTSKWRARNMPSLLDYVRLKRRVPPCLAMSLSAYLAFYTSDARALEERGLVCRRPKGNEYAASDDRAVLEFYYAHKDDSPDALARAALSNKAFWGADLTEVEGLEGAAAAGLRKIREAGARAALASCL